jgi:glycosyltransferase involved in cell wall biosynthesis
MSHHKQNQNRKNPPLEKDLPTASFLFVTRNRCPNKNPELNPLTWSFQTLLANSASIQITEWIVVDDGSTDFTTDTLKWIEDTYNISIKLFSYKKRKGCSYRRSQGIKQLGNQLFFMGDDDCLFRENFIQSSLKTWVDLKETELKLGVLALPILESRTSWNETVDAGMIGKTDFKNGWFYHNFDKEPQKNGSPLHQPFEIQTFSGVTLGLKKAFIDSGNFPDLSSWYTDYSEHLEMAFAMYQHGWKFFYLPNLEASTTHLKYGSKRDVLPEHERSQRFSGIELPLGELVDLSRKATKGGSRASDKIFVGDRIGTFVSFYLRVDPHFADSYVQSELDSKNVPKELLLQSVKKGVLDAEIISKKNYKSWHNKILKIISI